jgi:hypothetical protein
VARLLGIPNLIPATVSGPGALLVGPGLRVAAGTGGLAAGAEVLWTIRPDHVTVLPAARDGSAGGAANDGAGGGGEAYPAVVEDVADIGTLTTLTVRLGAGRDEAPELRVRTTAVVTLAPGDPCTVRLPAADITAWPAAAAPADEPGRDRLPAR